MAKGTEPRWVARAKVRSKDENSSVRHNYHKQAANDVLLRIVEECGTKSFTFDDLIDCLGAHSDEPLAQQRNRELKAAFNNLLRRGLIESVDDDSYEVTVAGRMSIE